MKIIILGSKGLLGQELSKTFRDGNPYLFDKDTLDITDVNALHNVFEQIEPDIIINAAAYKNVDGAEADVDMAVKVNGYAVGFLAEAAKVNNSKVVHYSTDYIFSGRKKEGYSEEDISNDDEPLSIYGRSKLVGEQELRSKLKRHYIIRTSWLFGAGGVDFVDKVIKWVEDSKELKAADDQHSKPTYVKDLAEATKALLAQELPFGTYHLVNEGATTRYEYVKKILEIYGKAYNWEASQYPKIIPVASSEFNDKAQRPKYSILNNNKFIHLRPWTEALEEYLSEKNKEPY